MNTSTRPRRARAAFAVSALALTGTFAASGSLAGAAPLPAAATTSSDSGLLPPAEGNVTYPLTITSALGEIVIPARPERIAVPDSWDVDIFAALGITPVGTDEQVEFYPWMFDRIDREAISVWPVGDLTFPPELIAATSPDLIVAGHDEVDNLAQLSAIAPVLGPPVTTDGDWTWRDMVLLLGEALDLNEAAQAVIDDYDGYFAGARDEHPQFAGKSVAYLVFWGADYGTGFINGTGSDAAVLFEQLGFAPSPEGDQYANDESDVSPEMMGRFADDVIVVVDQSGGGDEFRAFIDDPLLQSTPAARNGLLVELEFNFADDAVYYQGEPLDFAGHYGRALNVGPLGQLEVAQLLVPILAERLG